MECRLPVSECDCRSQLELNKRLEKKAPGVIAVSCHPVRAQQCTRRPPDGMSHPAGTWVSFSRGLMTCSQSFAPGDRPQGYSATNLQLTEGKPACLMGCANGAPNPPLPPRLSAERSLFVAR